MIRKLFRWVRNLFVLAWLLAVLILSWWIAYYNQQDIRINLLGLSLPEATVGLYLCITFASGVTIGWFGTWLLAKASHMSGRRELKKVKREVAQLKTAQVQE